MSEYGDYTFQPEDAERFAISVGAKVKRKGTELNFLYCPLCLGGSHKDKATFSISLKTGKCQCKRSGCAYKGNMITLARDFGFELTEGVTRYYNINNYNGQFRRFSKAHSDHIETSDKAIEYLKSRGISEQVSKCYEITTKKDQPNVLIFPFKDSKEELRFIKYRNIDYQKGKTEGAKEWCESKCMPILFGMNHCNMANKTLILTEGQIDSLSVTEAGYENAVSVPTGMNGFTWVPHCWNWVNQFEKIIIFGDKEGETITLVESVKNKFKLQILVVRVEDYKDCKDANEILQKYGKEQIAICIDNAEPLPAKNINRLSDSKSINVYELEKLATGISELDRFLYGGLPFEGVTIISGKTGEGKSTFASQIIAQALNQGYRTFIYSGELSNSLFKEALDRQLAGTHVVKYQDNSKWHDIRYMVPEDINNRISKWYENQCFIYNDSIFDDDYEPLLQTMENSIQQYNTRVLLIDNLMTALDLDKIVSSDRYEKQSLFVKKVVRLAVQYKVLIILVAHKRKDSQGSENDQIMGSSDISNLGMVTLSYGRASKDVCEAGQRLLKVSKNRLFGKVNAEGWVLDYQDGSKRIYGHNDNPDMEYDWINAELSPVSEMEDIPF